MHYFYLVTRTGNNTFNYLLYDIINNFGYEQMLIQNKDSEDGGSNWKLQSSELQNNFWSAMFSIFTITLNPAYFTE